MDPDVHKANDASRRGDEAAYRQHMRDADFKEHQRERAGAASAGTGGWRSVNTSDWDMATDWVLFQVFFKYLWALVSIVILASWWVGSADTVRSVLEAAPFGGWVAEVPRASGNPFAVGLTVLGLVALVILGTSWARRRIAKGVADHNVPKAALAAICALHIWVISSGIALIPVAVYVANASDIKATRNGDSISALGGIWAIAIVAVFLAWFTWSSYKRAVADERFRRA